METDYKHILDCLSPSTTNRQEWVEVGMALKYEGCPFELFDEWSSRDSRPGQYQGPEKTKKVWDSFRCEGTGVVTGASLVHMARSYGIDPFPKGEDGFFDWDDLVTAEGELLDPETIKRKPVPFKTSKKEAFQIIEYLEACFKPDDHVNVIPNSFTDPEGKLKPAGMGIITLTVSDYVGQLRSLADDPDFFSQVFGSYDPKAGVWIRVNPVVGKIDPDQKGIRDKHVTSFENALIECDILSLEEQIRIIKDLELPYKALVYSGGKSVHAIVRVDAKSISDYKYRVGWLQEYCIKHRLPVDTQNSNPSRMTRLPGCTRGIQKQMLLETAKPISFDEFKSAAMAKDEAKQMVIESFADVCDSLPEMAEEIIDGVLRKGHKMLISGPSKAGKSFSLIALAIAIAEGKEWMGYPCKQGKVLYLNFEIDRPSFFHRISDVYKAKGWKQSNPGNIQVMNLRGQAETLDKLVPKLEVILQKNDFSLVVIDPIYKVITGDENSASDMGKFCNLFDRIAQAGQTAVAYCHHHSKGSQAQKTAIDRASGSGVFARDPDAIVDMTEIGFTNQDREELKARLQEAVHDQLLRRTGQWENMLKIHPEWLQDRIQKQELAASYFEKCPGEEGAFQADLAKAEALGDCQAFRISMVLREFKSPEDVNVLFSYPIHVTDPTGYLTSLCLAGDNSIETLNKKKKEATEKRADKKREWYERQRAAGQMVTIADMKKQFGCAINTVRRWVDNQEDLKRENGFICKKDEIAPENLHSTTRSNED